MAALGLSLLGVYVVAIFGGGYLRRRRRGEATPFKLRRLRGAALAVAGLMTVALATMAAGPVFGLIDGSGEPAVLSGRAPQVLGAALFLAALALVGAAQRTMGASWRVGLDPDERTALVTAGPFGVVRNPIYVALVAMAAGEMLMVGNIASLAAVVLVVVAVLLQVRVVEEPYLRRIHGARFEAYCATTGRFAPRRPGPLQTGPA